MSSLWFRAILEALALIGSSIVSLWMLRSQIYHGYEALVWLNVTYYIAIWTKIKGVSRPTSKRISARG